jgi:hypothetical protein
MSDLRTSELRAKLRWIVTEFGKTEEVFLWNVKYQYGGRMDFLCGFVLLGDKLLDY